MAIADRRLPTHIMGWTVAGLGVLAVIVLSRPDAPSSMTVPAERPTEVVLLRVQPTVARGEHVFHGVVRTRQRALLSFTEGGRLVARPARIGDRVEAGDLLAQLDPTPYQNSVQASHATQRELELRGEQLTRERDRAARLAGSGVTTQARWEQAQSGLERIEAMQDAARVQVNESRRRRREGILRAPFDGLVTDVLVEPGELVSPGQPVLRLAGMDGREVLLEVPIAVANHLSLGDAVEMHAVGVRGGDPLATSPLAGQIRSVANAAASLGGLYPVVVDVQTPTHAGLGVEARLFGPEREAIRVPLSAVLDPSGRRPFVWTVVEHRAVRAWLRLGRLDGDQVEVNEGLAPGDSVVVRGHQRLLEGDTIAGDQGSPSARLSTGEPS